MKICEYSKLSHSTTKHKIWSNNFILNTILPTKVSCIKINNIYLFLFQSLFNSQFKYFLNDIIMIKVDFHETFFCQTLKKISYKIHVC